LLFDPIILATAKSVSIYETEVIMNTLLLIEALATSKKRRTIRTGVAAPALKTTALRNPATKFV